MSLEPRVRGRRETADDFRGQFLIVILGHVVSSFGASEMSRTFSAVNGGWAIPRATNQAVQGLTIDRPGIA